MQKIEKGGGDLTLPKQIEFAWGQFVLSVSRTRGMLMQVEGLSLEERERLIADYGAKVADAIDVFVERQRESSHSLLAYTSFQTTSARRSLVMWARPSLIWSCGASALFGAPMQVNLSYGL
jgi:hypothetical protein